MMRDSISQCRLSENIAHFLQWSFLWGNAESRPDMPLVRPKLSYTWRILWQPKMKSPSRRETRAAIRSTSPLETANHSRTTAAVIVVEIGLFAISAEYWAKVDLAMFNPASQSVLFFFFYLKIAYDNEQFCFRCFHNSPEIKWLANLAWACYVKQCASR